MNLVQLILGLVQPYLAQPTLQVDFAYPSANRGHYTFRAGQANLNLGAITLTASESMVVDTTIVIQTYANDTVEAYGPGSLYSRSSNGALDFADHFPDCYLQDYNTGTVYSTAAVINGQLAFPVSIYVDETAYVLASVHCDHSGLAPTGSEDGFAIDIAYPVVTTATTLDGEVVAAAVGDWNGMESPSKSYILIP